MSNFARYKKSGTGDPLHTQEPVTVASFRTWRGWRERVARDRCLTYPILTFVKKSTACVAIRTSDPSTSVRQYPTCSSLPHRNHEQYEYTRANKPRTRFRDGSSSGSHQSLLWTCALPVGIHWLRNPGIDRRIRYSHGGGGQQRAFGSRLHTDQAPRSGNPGALDRGPHRYLCGLLSR